ncbi:OFA family MFS transporter [Amycolatopsis keratiniphila]|uniref:MFS transporter n=1 Tax=Amycolatopsis keratiniphila subsp. keratiniphila TaxID=227715 RepID=A0A1W2M124_9PSEU|nr:OFA family MFS transporter [Amycolatopsis keratiniphila]ONF73517.1 MFS transporter [Amycolatopsis keratiniphila subsp. keratiniphila]
MPDPRILRDHYGRRYRVGESDVELLGKPRSWMSWLSWAAMFAAGIQQYGFGVVAPVLMATYGWTFPEVVVSFALWTVCQACVVYPVARLRERGMFPPAVAVIIGGVLCSTGMFTLGHASNLLTMFIGYSVLGGIGTGVVYATCVGTVMNWFPDRIPARVGAVSGAFAYGSVVFVLAGGFWLTAGTRRPLLDVVAVAVLMMIASTAVLLRDPPPRWWPEHPDPRVWAADKVRNRGVAVNRPALREYRPSEVLRCPTAVAMYLIVVLAAAVLLFDVAYLATFVAAQGGGPVLAAVALAVLAGVTGAGRVLLGGLSDRLGRRRILRLALATGGIAQFVLLYAGHNAAGLVAGAALAGLGNGSCYSLLVSLVRDYFGEESALQNFGVLYSAKAVGALLGVGLAAFVVSTHGYLGAFAVAGVLSVLGALLGGRLSQPGRPKSLLPAIR